MTTSPAIPADSATAPEGADTSRTPRRWWKFWKLPIGVQSLIAVGVGALIGTFAPAVGEQLKLAGDVFLNLVQMIVVPLVFPLIVLGIARMDSAKKVGRMAAKAILYFEIVTTIILLMAVALAKLLDIGSGAPVAGATKPPSRPSSRASTSTNYSCTLSRRTSSPPSRRGTCWQ